MHAQTTAQTIKAVVDRLASWDHVPVAIHLHDNDSGIVLYHRGTDAVWEDRPYVVHPFRRYPDPERCERVGLGNGSYDMTLEEGIEVFKKRSRF